MVHSLTDWAAWAKSSPAHKKHQCAAKRVNFRNCDKGEDQLAVHLPVVALYEAFQ